MSLVRRRGWWLLGAVLLLLLALNLATAPPIVPSYAVVRKAWRPSEAWLYDRNGELLDSSRVDFARRRLAWTERNAQCVVRVQSRGCFLGIQFLRHCAGSYIPAVLSRTLGERSATC